MQALLPLVSESTDRGKIKAAQALAKITITSNPEIAFPGERVRQQTVEPFSLISIRNYMRMYVFVQVYEVVRPLVSLLALDCTMLQNFEALMALTNLAGFSERLRSAANN